MDLPATSNREQLPTPTAQPPKRDKRSLTAASQASLTAHLRQEQAADVEHYLLTRLPAILRLGYQTADDAQTHASLVREFVGALSHLPIWALAEAMDAWVSQHNRRPSPAELLLLASRAMQPITEEIAYRKRMAEQKAEEERRKDRPDALTIASIAAEYGFTPQRLAAVASGSANRMAKSVEELDTAPHDALAAHWSETAAPDDPRRQELRRARATSPIVPTRQEPGE